jgi:hypothetical protein
MNNIAAAVPVQALCPSCGVVLASAPPTSALQRLQRPDPALARQLGIAVERYRAYNDRLEAALRRRDE